MDWIIFFKFIGHNEDALSETIMHVYIVSAHIIPADNERGGVFDVREEKWTSLTYAGSLSGYASGYNYHGLVYSINTIFAKNLMRKRIRKCILQIYFNLQIDQRSKAFMFLLNNFYVK